MQANLVKTLAPAKEIHHHDDDDDYGEDVDDDDGNDLDDNGDEEKCPTHPPSIYLGCLPATSLLVNHTRHTS